MLRSTFQLVPGIGPRRERRLWEAGLTDWSDLPDAPARLLPERSRRRLVDAAARVEAALALGTDALSVAARALPASEHWRLFPIFESDAVYLDIETDFQEGITAIGLCDRNGPRLLLPWQDLDRFPELCPPDRLLVTFNGAAFDVPVLRRFFPQWRPPPAHINLRPLLARLGERGGLKAIEERLGLGRPDHLRGLNGRGAAALFRWAGRGDRSALRLFAEYNLYDTVNLRTLLAIGYNRMVEMLGAPAGSVSVSFRGDVLYDVSKVLLAL
jgi:uncharacterized protein YprB with RNaseH-like and TPR domain